MQTLWKSKSRLHCTFEDFNQSLKEDWFFLPFELRLQQVHARTLQAASILTHEECASIVSALADIEEDFTGKECPDSGAEDLHTWIEVALVDAVGEAGKKIHTARSRNDQVATLLKMYVVSAGRCLSIQLADLVRLFCSRAKGWADLVFPLQTHCQYAAPGSVGFWSLRYAAAFARMQERVETAVNHWSQYCPLGSGAVAGSAIPINRNMQAVLLGFAKPSVNALDATCSRDECLEFINIAAGVALHLQSLATDVISFAQTQLGWIVYPDGFGTGSSMMPNKTNPDAMELLRGESNSIIASVGHSFLLMKGLSSGYNRDLQCIKPIIHGAAVKLADLLRMTDEFVRQLEFAPQRLQKSLAHGQIGATLSMEERVMGGTPLREAHHAVAEEIRTGQVAGSDSAAHGPDSYCTVGSASPRETVRIANELLAKISG